MLPSIASRTGIYRHHHLDSTRWDAVRLRWRAALTPADVGLYDAVGSGLDPALRAWLEDGRKGD